MEFLMASITYFKIASQKTTCIPPKVMLLVERSSKNTDIRHHKKLPFLGDVLAKTIIYWGLKSTTITTISDAVIVT